MPTSLLPAEPEGKRLAVLAEVLFLANLLIAPGLAFAWLAWLWWRHREAAPALARNHLGQALAASLWAGALLVGGCLAIFVLSGHRAETWTVLILYFTCVHSTLVLAGILGLARAMAGRHWHYPLIGAPGAGN